MYYVYENGQQLGPLKLEELKNHHLSADSKIWRDDLKDWTTVKHLPEVVSALSLKIVEKKPSLNGMIFANIVIQILVTMALHVSLEEESMDDGFYMVLVSIMVGCILLYIVSIVLLMQRQYVTARVLSIISCILFVPIGLVGIFGMNKAIEKVKE